MNGRYYVYIDESGDLGFDFTHLKTSHYFIMTALVCQSSHLQLAITRAIKKTIKNKVTERIHELKGSNTSLSIKCYFYKHICDYLGWDLYAVIVDKKFFARNLKKDISKMDKNQFYDAVAGKLLEKLNYTSMHEGASFIFDRSKSQEEIEIFNKRASQIIKKQLQNERYFTIVHAASFEIHMLQAVDLFCWGVHRKYEKQDESWYNIFKEKVKVEDRIKL